MPQEKPNPRDVLTPDTFALLRRIADTGSFAAAARAVGMVPSALTYRMRQIEEALDVLLFDRSARQARLTEAGRELVHEGGRLLDESMLPGLSTWIRVRDWRAHIRCDRPVDRQAGRQGCRCNGAGCRSGDCPGCRRHRHQPYHL